MYKIKKTANKENWDNFLNEVQPQSFLQDFEWGEIEKSLGHEILRLEIYNSQTNADLMGVCQIIGYKAKRGNFLLIPHGPVLSTQIIIENQFASIIIEIIKFLKLEDYHKRYAFIRLNSSTLFNDDDIAALKKIEFRPAPIYSVSENMWVKNLQKSEEELLNEMTSTNKKLVNDAMKKPYLEIECSTALSKIDEFWKIYEDLAKRKEFAPYSYNLIKKEFEIFGNEKKALLYFGKVEGKIVSCALIVYSHNIAFYHHSGSLPIKEPINHKLQWQIILDAKNAGCKYYNFWGITLSVNKKHPWWGLTQFKKGFGGELLKFIPAMDYAFSKKYWFNFAIEKIRRKIKKL
ncbi:MAG: peptidoglycan bridge formation glycyltransferase FemA/FemB family protein [Patescibacteria group bacterium]